MDLALPPALLGKRRRDWGLEKMVTMENPARIRSEHAKLVLKQKIENFIARAIYPQQLTVSRQYATTAEGCRVVQVLEGREIDGYREPGVRVVVQENEQRARFIMSPLFASKTDALGWAVHHTGAEI